MMFFFAGAEPADGEADRGRPAEAEESGQRDDSHPYSSGLVISLSMSPSVHVTSALPSTFGLSFVFIVFVFNLFSFFLFSLFLCLFIF